MVLGLPLAAVIAVAGVLVLALVGFLAMKMRKPKAAADPGKAPELPSFDSSLAEQLPSFDSHPMLEGGPNLSAPIRSAPISPANR